MTGITLNNWTIILELIAQVMHDNADLLCEMDAHMGDGDLGLTMKKGYAALPKIFDGLDETDMGKRLFKCGIKMSSIVPSTMGTLMASGWMEAGKCLLGVEAMHAAEYAGFLQGFTKGIMKRGKCCPGDRTVLDALLPAAQGAQKAVLDGCELVATAQAALDGAKVGLEASKTMLPKYGKAAVFSAKAIGVVDQGAYAGMLLMQGLLNGIQQEGV